MAGLNAVAIRSEVGPAVSAGQRAAAFAAPTDSGGYRVIP
jgi:hypothetical protein